MTIDTSALVAILRDEPESEAFAMAIATAAVCVMSAASYVETAAVIDAADDPIASRQVDELVRAAGIEIAPVTDVQARIAREAYRDFAKRRGHPASLSLGACFSYALAIDRDDELLFKGDDFSHTDVRAATW